MRLKKLFIFIVFLFIKQIVLSQGVPLRYDILYDPDLKPLSDLQSNIKLSPNQEDFKEFGKWNIPASIKPNPISSNLKLEFNWFAYERLLKDTVFQGYRLMNYEDLNSFKKKLVSYNNEEIWCSKKISKNEYAEVYNTAGANTSLKPFFKEAGIFLIQTKDNYYENLNKPYDDLIDQTYTMKSQSIDKNLLDIIKNQHKIKTNGSYEYSLKGEVRFLKDTIEFDGLKGNYGADLANFKLELDDYIRNWSLNNFIYVKIDSRKKRVPTSKSFELTISKSVDGKNITPTYDKVESDFFNSILKDKKKEHVLLPLNTIIEYDSIHIRTIVNNEKAPIIKSIEIRKIKPSYDFIWIHNLYGGGYWKSGNYTFNLNQKSIAARTAKLLKKATIVSIGTFILSRGLKNIFYNQIYLNNPQEKRWAYSIGSVFHQTSIISAFSYGLCFSFDLYKTIHTIKKSKLELSPY